jgi:hypothetical protein
LGSKQELFFSYEKASTHSPFTLWPCILLESSLIFVRILFAKRLFFANKIRTKTNQRIINLPWIFGSIVGLICEMNGVIQGGPLHRGMGHGAWGVGHGAWDTLIVELGR